MAEIAHPLFGVAAEFTTPGQIVEAAAKLRQHDFGRIDAFTPAPVPGLQEALGYRGISLQSVGIAVAALGVLGYFAMILYATMASYPLIIGGRPPFSWPYYVIPSTSIGMLLGALAVTLGMMFLTRLPRLNHPAFNIAGFERATSDRYFLTVEARDERFDPDAVEQFLRSIAPAPVSIQRVPR